MVGAKPSEEALPPFPTRIVRWIAMTTGTLRTRTWLISVSMNRPGACRSCNTARKGSIELMCSGRARGPRDGSHFVCRLPSDVRNMQSVKHSKRQSGYPACPCAACQLSFRTVPLDGAEGALTAGLVGLCYKVNSRVSSEFSSKRPVGGRIVHRPLHLQSAERSDLIEINDAAYS